MRSVTRNASCMQTANSHTNTPHNWHTSDIFKAASLYSSCKASPTSKGRVTRRYLVDHLPTPSGVLRDQRKHQPILHWHQRQPTIHRLRCPVKDHHRQGDAPSLINETHPHSRAKDHLLRGTYQSHTRAPQPNYTKRMQSVMAVIHMKEYPPTAKGCTSCQSLGLAKPGNRVKRGTTTGPRRTHLQAVLLLKTSRGTALR